MSGNFGSRRSSQDGSQGSKLAPLQHMESLEEWSSGESMAFFNNLGYLDPEVGHVSGNRKSMPPLSSSNTNSPSYAGVLNSSTPLPASKLVLRNSPELNEVSAGGVHGVQVRSKLNKDISVPNFSTALLEQSGVNKQSDGEMVNSRPVSVVIEMESLLNKDSNSTTV